ncbi:MAG: sugar transferase [Candidatus Magasanikbacteria bacterium]|nr:sugar transferase [Candidatus Magasanikbacteria bacterium]
MYYRIKQLLLLSGDIIALYAGFYIGVALRYQEWAPRELPTLLPPISQLFLGAVVVLFIIGLYDIGRIKNSRTLYQKILLSAGIWVILAIVYFYIKITALVTPKTTLLGITLGSFGLLALWRTFYNRFLSTVIWRTSIVFAGVSNEVAELAHLITTEPERGFVIAGLIVPPQKIIPVSLQAYPVAETLTELTKKNNAHYPELVVLNPALRNNTSLLAELYHAIFRQITILDLAEFYETMFRRIPPFTFSEAWFITNLKEQRRKIYDRARILVDYALALIMLIPFGITFPFIAALVLATSPGPVFFKQKRVGRLGRVFTIYKYRTMLSLNPDGSAETAGPQFAEVGDRRVTAVGRLLRRTRLDELPQALNILRGDMSLIGPRPERPEFVKQLTEAMPFYTVRHLVKPGLTGWAQLQQAYYGDIEENLYKLQYDLYYIKNRNFFFDATILLKTVAIIARFMGR